MSFRIPNRLNFNITVQVYGVATRVPVEETCNAVTVKNAGTTLLFFNGDPLQPGESKSAGGNYGEIYMGRVDLQFVTQTPPPTTITNLAVVTQKFYVDSTPYDPIKEPRL
jgi:hypothetical protein